MFRTRVASFLTVFLLSGLLTACGGGGSSGASPTGSSTSASLVGVQTYPVIATVSGLNPGATVALLDNSGDPLTISANGSVAFHNQLAAGSNYDVSVSAQPLHQTCTATSGSGTISALSPAAVDIDCVTNQYFAYLGYSDASSISPWVLNAASGTPTSLPVSLVSTNYSSPEAYLFGAPNGHYLFFDSPGQGGISAYSINAITGVPIPVPGGSITVQEGLFSPVVTPNSQFVYAEGNPSGNIYGYVINQSTGSLAPIAGSPFHSSATATTIQHQNVSPLAVSSDGAHLYEYSANGEVFGFHIDSSTGALSGIPGSPFPAQAPSAYTPFSLCASPTSPYLYAFSHNGNNAAYVSGYKIDAATGALTSVPGSPFLVNDIPSICAISPGGNFLFSGGGAYSGVDGFSINASTGSLTPVSGSPYLQSAFFSANSPGWDNYTSMQFSPSGDYLYLGPYPITVFNVNSLTGVLTLVGSPVTPPINGDYGFTIVQP